MSPDFYRWSLARSSALKMWKRFRLTVKAENFISHMSESFVIIEKDIFVLELSLTRFEEYFVRNCFNVDSLQSF